MSRFMSPFDSPPGSKVPSAFEDEQSAAGEEQETRHERNGNRQRARGHDGEHNRPLSAVAAKERAVAPV